MAWCGQATHAIRNWDALFFQCLKERYISNPTTSFTDCWTHLDLFVRETTSKLMDHPYTLSTQSKTHLNLLDGKVGLDTLIFYKAEEPPWNIWR